MRAIVQMNHARAILEGYDDHEPLNVHVRRYFGNHRQIGSRDRRLLRNLVYGAHRLGHWRFQLTSTEAVTLGHFLTSRSPDAFLHYWLPKVSATLPDNTALPLEDKWSLIADEFGVALRDVFPLWNKLSNHIDKAAYIRQCFNPLPVYAYPAQLGIADVRKALDKGGFSYHELNGTFSFPPETRLQALPDKVYQQMVVQDLNSRRVIDSLPLAAGQQWWDCCAGAGGKSIRMKITEPGLELWATDKRPKILKNLKHRLRETGVELEHVHTLDLSEPLPDSWPLFDGILLDAPCTGSGTWARTPERITQVDQETIEQFRELQKDLALHALQALKPGGMLVYVTCSVFEAENEGLLAHLTRNGYKVCQQQYLEGYSCQAETFFMGWVKGG